MAENPLTTSEIRETVNFIIKFRDSKQIVKLKSKSLKEYNDKMNSTFSVFKYNYPSIFDVILENQNIEYLYKMLDMKEKIENGGDKDVLEREMGELLAKKFIYPVVK